MILYTGFAISKGWRKTETFSTPDEALAWANEQAMLGGYRDYAEWVKKSGSFEEGTAYIVVSRFDDHTWESKDFTSRLMDFAAGKVRVWYETTLFSTHAHKKDQRKQFILQTLANNVMAAQELAIAEWAVGHGHEWVLDDTDSVEIREGKHGHVSTIDMKVLS